MTPTPPGLVVALDGPASSGKSSVGAAAAGRLGYRFFDTGLLYRATTYAALKLGVALDDPVGLMRVSDQVHPFADERGRITRVSFGEANVSDLIHGPEVDAAVSAVSRVPELREHLIGWQRRIAESGRIIVAGRDIGTVVLPDADLKLFIDASPEERARRRAEERGIDPDGAEAQEILRDLRQRDAADSSRAIAPLRIPAGATVIRTDGNVFETTVDLVVAAITARAEALATPDLAPR